MDRSGSTSLYMGHGQTIALAVCGADVWELHFSTAGVPDAVAPPPGSVKVEVIDHHGVVHPLSMAAGNSARSVRAAGTVPGAYRARVMVRHGDHVHTREAPLPGRTEIAPVVGPRGGAMVGFPTDTVEVRLAAPDTFELHFAISTPPPEAVVMQAIGPIAEDYQIRNLVVRPGDGAATLVATGKIRDAAYLRLSIGNGANAMVRSVPVMR